MKILSAAVLVLAASLRLPAYASEPEGVTMVQLIADPAKFDGHIVRVIGYLHLEFEGNVLYLHKEDYERAILGNGIWVSLTDSQRKTSSKIGGSYAIAEGRFNAKDKGHMGMWSGSLENITRLEAWKSHR